MAPKKNLAVEIDRRFCELIAEGIAAKGRSITRCSCPEEGRNQLFCDSWDLLIIDPDVSGMDGFMSFAALNAVPCIAVTKCESLDVVVHFYSLGCFKFLHKPMEMKELRKTVSAALMVGVPQGGADAHSLTTGGQE